MNYEERFVAFIDILGFTDAIKKTVEKNNGKEIENSYEIDKIDNLLNEIRYQLIKDKYLPIKKLEIKDRVVSQFSDSVIISYLKDNAIYNILYDIYFLCIMALEKGFLFRGAVTYGKVIHTDTETNKKLFGPAYIKAYEMEQKQSIFPRIIIDDDVLNIAKENYSKCADFDYDKLLELIPFDFDGKRYINYIDKLYTGVGVGVKDEQKHLMCIDEIIRKMDISDDSIKCKHLWLKDKYDIALEKFEKSLNVKENSSYSQ